MRFVALFFICYYAVNLPFSESESWFQNYVESIFNFKRNTIQTDCKNVCGAVQRSKRIVGGERASIDRDPWMVTLSKGGNVDCGGALINRCYVLTAAHCFKRDPDNILIMVTLGTAESANLFSLRKRVSKMIRYPTYTRETTNDDIMLLKLDSPVDYSDYLRPICLPDPDQNFTGRILQVMGFGSTAYHGFGSSGLREVGVRVFSKEECLTVFGDEKHPIYPGNICAGGEQGKDACQGDSGAPLVLKEDHMDTLAGVVSWGVKCALDGVPGVYTSVSHYVDWIMNVTSEGGCCLPTLASERHT